MNDLEFVSKCVLGDKQALEEFLTRYSRLIYKYIYSALSAKGFSRDQASAEDLFQEIILSLFEDNFRKLKTFKGKNGCSLASWLRIVTINYTLDYTRRINLISLDAETDDNLSLKDIIPSNSRDVVEGLSSEETLIGLHDCIEVLSTDDKYFIELHFNRSLGLEELMEHFSASRPAIDMRKSRLIEKLRDCFKSKGFFR